MEEWSIVLDTKVRRAAMHAFIHRFAYPMDDWNLTPFDFEHHDIPNLECIVFFMKREKQQISALKSRFHTPTGKAV